MLILEYGGEKMLGFIVRFVVSALVLMVVDFILPNFSVAGFTGALIAAAIIAILGYIVEKLLGKSASPQARGVVGFISSAVVIYVAQFFTGALNTSILGALLAAFIIGIADIFVPTELR